MAELILVVDDDTDIRDTLAELLIEHGYEVMTAENGQVALDRMRTRRPDLVILDLMMPVKDGWTTRREMLANPALATIPVVILSASGNAERAAEMFPMDAALSKPFDFVRLLNVIAHHAAATG